MQQLQLLRYRVISGINYSLIFPQHPVRSANGRLYYTSLLERLE